MTLKAGTGSRITNITFNSSTAVEMDGTTSSSTCRIDHNTFTNAGQVVFVNLSGNAPCLIDHNTFTGGGATENIHDNGLGASSFAGWQDDIVPGSSAMIFVEDNTFNCSDASFFCTAINGFYGSRDVVRHNTFNFTQVDMHGTAGAIGARWWEIYQNTFCANGKTQSNYAQIRAGTGVYWGNVIGGGCTNGGAGANQFAEEDTVTTNNAVTGTPECAGTVTGGSPTGFCLFQIGRGRYAGTPTNNGTSSPAYYWGNDAGMSLVLNSMTTNTSVRSGTDINSSGSSQPGSLLRCQSAADVATGCPVSYSYSSYQYPHPLNQ